MRAAFLLALPLSVAGAAQERTVAVNPQPTRMTAGTGEFRPTDRTTGSV